MKKAIKFFEEEIARLENAPKINGCEMTDEWKEQLEFCKTAKSAIEKQIPKKINNFSEDSDISACVPKTKSGNCPICNAFIWGERAYCEKCGQALDWSETE